MDGSDVRANEIDDDAVADLEAGFLGEPVIRGDTDTDDDEVDIYGGSIGKLRGGDMTVPADELLQSGLLANDDIMLPVYRPEDVSRFLGRDTLQDSVAHFDQGDLEAAMARDGGGLKSDIPAADDEDPASGAHFARKKISIALVAGEIDAFERATDGRRQPARSGARRKRQRFIA